MPTTSAVCSASLSTTVFAISAPATRAALATLAARRVYAAQRRRHGIRGVLPVVRQQPGGELRALQVQRLLRRLLYAFVAAAAPDAAAASAASSTSAVAAAGRSAGGVRLRASRRHRPRGVLWLVRKRPGVQLWDQTRMQVPRLWILQGAAGAPHAPAAVAATQAALDASVVSAAVTSAVSSVAAAAAITSSVAASASLPSNPAYWSPGSASTATAAAAAALAAPPAALAPATAPSLAAAFQPAAHRDALRRSRHVWARAQRHPRRLRPRPSQGEAGRGHRRA